MTTDIIAKVQRCKVCGFVAATVKPGVAKTKDGRYLVILRCDDALACQSRKDERDRR